MKAIITAVLLSLATLSTVAVAGENAGECSLICSLPELPEAD